MVMVEQMTTDRLSTPIIYPGGKTLLLPHIRPLVPPHRICLDLFGGGGAFILDDSHEIGVYNDINQESVNFFRVLRDSNQSTQLLRLLENTPYSREEYYACYDSWSIQSDMVERARRWFVAVNMGFTHEAHNRSFRVAKNTHIARALRNHVDDIPAIVDKLRDILVENLDFRKAMEIYGSGKDTLIFADPPYITPDNRESLSYENVMTMRDHQELLHLLDDTDADVILCGYNSMLYQMELHPSRWTLVKKVRVAAVGNSNYKSRETREEHIWVKKRECGLFA